MLTTEPSTLLLTLLKPFPKPPMPPLKPAPQPPLHELPRGQQGAAPMQVISLTQPSQTPASTPVKPLPDAVKSVQKNIYFVGVDFIPYFCFLLVFIFVTLISVV